MKDKLKDGASKCRKSMKLIEAGKICYLISGQASEKASWDGTNINISVDTEAVGTELESCSDMIDANCTLATGESTQTDLAIEDTANFEKTSVLAQRCKALKEQKDCTTDCKEKFAELIRYDPSKKDSLPDEAQAKGMKEKM